MRVWKGRPAGYKSLLFASLLLASAFILALVSTLARREGQPYASAVFALTALVLAGISSAILVPRLLSRVRLDLLERLYFIRLTKRGGAYIAIVLIIAFAALNTGNNLLVLILSFLLAAMIASGIISSLDLQGLQIALNLPPAIHAGQRAAFLVTLRNLKKLVPSFAVTLRSRAAGSPQDQSTNFFLQAKNFPYIRAREEFQLTLHCSFKRRGVYPVEGFEVRTAFPFGLFSKGRQLPAEGQIVVYPELRDLHQFLAAHPNLQGQRELRRIGQGSGLYKVRPYQRGESTRNVHWKSTAKLSQLMVKDFMAEEDRPPKILFSTFLPNPDEAVLESFEKGVSYVASLAYHYRKAQMHFSFSSGEFSAEVNGKAEEYERLMQYLACVVPSQRPVLPRDPIHEDAILFAAGDSVGLEGIQTVDYLSLP